MAKLTALYPDPAIIWQTYVGDVSPADFLNQQGCSDIEACVASYVDPLPRFEGIVRQAGWPETFTAEYQLRRDAVVRGLLEHLENSRADWEPHWNLSDSPSPTSAPAQEETADSGEEPAADTEESSEASS